MLVAVAIAASDSNSRVAVGMSRARAFRSPSCAAKRARQGASFERWVAPGAHATTVVLSARVPLRAVAEPLRRRGRNGTIDVVYVGNQKAGSTTFTRELGGVLHAAVDARCACLGEQCARWDRNCARDRATLPLAPVGRDDAVAFTFVHDPVHVFWAGVRQALCHKREREEHDHPHNSSFLRLPPEDWPSVAGLEALLDDMRNARYVGEPFFHAWPQAVKVDARLPAAGDAGPLPLAFVGELSHLDEDLAAAFGGSAPPNDNAPHGTRCEAELEAAVANLPRVANRTVCDLVAVDFECFDLPRSPSCAVDD